MQFITITVAAMALLLTDTVLGAPAVDKRQAGSSCGWTNNTLWNSWSIVIANGQGFGLCQGFRDNLNGQCGDSTTNWTCGDDAAGTTTATWNSPTTCSGSQVGNAIYIATSPNLSGVTCVQH